MRPVRVPPAHRDSIRRLAEFSDEDFGKFASVLAVAESGELRRSDLVTAVVDTLGEESERASLLLDALLGASTVKQTREAPSADIAEAIAAEPGLKLDAETASRVAARLATLLDLPSLELIARATRLFAEDDQTFCRSRTLSDLRPVFDPATEPPAVAAAVIRHSLKVRYHVEDGIEAFHVSIDEKGLLELRGTIDRALAKGQALRDLAQAAGMRIVDVEESH